MDPTIEHYCEILEAALRSGRLFRGFHQSVSESENRVVYLRHDLDICLEEALDMAALEEKLGVSATYFILINSPIYNVLAEDSLKILHKIQRSGHWIGLHLDPVLLPGDDTEIIEGYISKVIEFYSSRIPLVPVVSFHRPKSNVLRRNFYSFVSTYSPRFFESIKYISDSRGEWRNGCPCQRLARPAYNQPLQMLVHPIWWRSTESDRLSDRLNQLLGERIGRLKQYLGDNIEPIGELLKKGDAK